MDRVETSGSDLDLDIDLESGGTSDDDDDNTVQDLSGKSSKNLLSGMSSRITTLESPYASRIDTDCSCSYDERFNSDEIFVKNKKMEFREFDEETTNFLDKGKPKNSIRPPKPPRPPGGPSLHASDIKMLKEISELNSRRKMMKRMRALRKTKKEKASALSSSLFPCLVTIIFFLVIIFQGKIYALSTFQIAILSNDMHEKKSQFKLYWLAGFAHVIYQVLHLLTLARIGTLRIGITFLFALF